MVVYCLFCETAKCVSVLAQARRAFQDRGWITGYSPRQIQRVWKHGKVVNQVRQFLPGYIFLYFEEPFADMQPLRALAGVIRVLHDANNVYELSDADLSFAEMVREKDGCLGKTQVYREGDRICIQQGAFNSLDVKILKVNRRNHTMMIQIPLAGEWVKAWIQYEEDERKESI